MDRRISILMLLMTATAALVGCSVHVQESGGKVDIKVNPPSVSIRTGIEPKTQTATLDLPSEARSLEVAVNHAVGELRIDGQGSAALSGSIGYWEEPPMLSSQLSGTHFRIEVRGEKNLTTISDRAPRTELHLGARVPTRLTVSAGVGEAHVDLTAIPVTQLHLKAGVGKVTVLLPADRNVRVELSAGIGAHSLADAGFVRQGSAWVTPGFREQDVLLLRLEAGVGDFRIERR